MDYLAIEIEAAESIVAKLIIGFAKAAIATTITAIDDLKRAGTGPKTDFVAIIATKSSSYSKKTQAIVIIVITAAITAITIATVAVAINA